VGKGVTGKGEKSKRETMEVHLGVHKQGTGKPGVGGGGQKTHEKTAGANEKEETGNLWRASRQSACR